MPPSAAERQTRLRQIARSYNVDVDEPPVRLHPTKARKALLVSRKDRQEAQRLVNQSARKARTLSVLHRHVGILPHLYRYEHVEKALATHVHSSGSPSVAHALIDCLRWARKDDQRTVSPNTFKLQPGLLTFAIRVDSSDLGLIDVLAPHADSRELEKALLLAVDANDRPKWSLLLQHGADPNALRRHLVKAIASNDNTFVSAVLRAGPVFSGKTIEAALTATIQADNFEALSSLLRASEAVESSKHDAALKNCTQSEWDRDMLLSTALKRDQYKALVTLAYYTSTRPLINDTLYSEVVKRCRNVPELIISLTEIFLCLDESATAARKVWQGESLTSDNGLVDARFLWLLVSHGVPMSSQAFQIAGAAGRLDILVAMLRNGVDDGAVAWRSVEYFSTELQGRARNLVIETFIRSQRSGFGWSDDAVIHATKQQRPDWIPQLVALGASTTHNNGEALKIAVQNGNRPAFEQLMSQPVSFEIASALLPQLMELEKEARRKLMASFLSRPCPHWLITPVLDDLLRDRSEDRDFELINLLVDTQAWCTHRGMASSFEHYDLETLKRFLAVQKRLVYSRPHVHGRDQMLTVLIGNMQFLVNHLPVFKTELRELCIGLLDVSICQWADLSPGTYLGQHIDLPLAFERGPVDHLLVNLFGKHRRRLALTHQYQVTGFVVCSQPIHIARAFIQYLPATRGADRNHDFRFPGLILQVASHYFPDDLDKAAKLEHLYRGYDGSVTAANLIEHCLEVHMRSLVNSSGDEQWPVVTTRLLAGRSTELDDHVYACLRMSAFHEQLGTLDSILSIPPSRLRIGGDMLRPLIRYQKTRSLQYLLSRWTSPSLAEQAFYYSQNIGTIDMAILILNCGIPHSDDANCRCLRGVILAKHAEIVEGLIVNRSLDASAEVEIWDHLDPQPYQPEKHRLLATLLQSQPSRELVQRMFRKAARSADVDLCGLILQAETLSTRNSRSEALIEDGVVHQAILSAIERGDVSMCDLLLAHGASVEYNGHALIRSAIESHTVRDIDILSSIIARANPARRSELLNECLWRATVFNKKATCAWLLSKGASPLIRGYGPFLTAADRGLVEILKMFVQQHRGREDVLNAAFKSSQSTNFRTSVPETQRVEVVRMLLDAGMQDLETLSNALITSAQETKPSATVVKMLLDAGASVTHRQSQCLIDSWRAGNVWLLKLMCQGHSRLSTAAHCLKHACADYHKIGPRDIDLLEVVAFLLGLGVPQDVLDLELASALEMALSESKEWNMRLVYLLVNRGAALDPASAKSLYRACLAGDDVFIRTAMRFGPTQETRLEALKLLFSDVSRGSDSDVSCMNSLFAHGDVATAIDCDVLKEMLKLILLTRKTMPLLNTLLSKRISARNLNDCLGRMLSSQPEKFRELLQWAITRSSDEVSSSCISGLARCVFFEEKLKSGHAHRSTRLSAVLWAEQPQSLLILALKHDRPSLIPMMIQLGADPDVRDKRLNSALALAIARRYVKAADTLFTSGTRINDGSLHAAACVQDLDMIRRLREQGHTATSRPVSYSGHTVLETFLRHKHSDEKQLSETLKALMGGIEKPGLWVSSPGHLWVALGSTMPCSLTIALLDNMPRQKRNVDDLCLSKNRYYSALTWVERDRCPHLESHMKLKLVQYLENAGFRRIFYAVEGPQPEGAIGVPQHLLDKENDRQQRQAYLEKNCAVCGDRPEVYTAIYAQITSSCGIVHSWKDEIICSDCVAGHITAQIFPDGKQNRARSSPRCWAQKCSATLNHAEVQQYLDTHLFQEYDSKLALQLLHSNSQSARCANRAIKCGGGAWFSNADLEELTFFRCPVCQELTCLQCNSLYEPSHLSTPCPVGLHKKREQEDEQSEDVVKKISKTCECGARIQKSDGCDHMTCNQCRREWCYDCLVPYEEIRGGDNSAHRSTCKHYRPGTGRRVRW